MISIGERSVSVICGEPGIGRVWTTMIGVVTRFGQGEVAVYATYLW